jgi:hypothetical protein
VAEGSLRRRIGARLSADQAVPVALGLCEALEYAHRRGLPHRNLVPENVFFEASRRVRVSDFGLTLLHPRPPLEVARGDARGDLRAVVTILRGLVAAPPPRLEGLFAHAAPPDGTFPYARAGELGLALRLIPLDGAAPVAEPPRERAPQGSVTWTTSGKLVVVTISADARIEDADAAFDDLENVLARPGPFRVGYDLTQLQTCHPNLCGLLQRLHARQQRSLERVAFCSPRALVRGAALTITGGTRRLESRIFAAAEPMRRWLEEAGA